MTEAGPAASLAGVTHRYGKVTALDALTLDIPAGRMIGVIGPDGVGKSTLLALIAGVRRIQSGGVQALGGDLALQAEREARRGRIAYMPQGLGRNLYPTLSVFENIDFHARLFGQGGDERHRRADPRSVERAGGGAQPRRDLQPAGAAAAGRGAAPGAAGDRGHRGQAGTDAEGQPAGLSGAALR